MTRGKTFCGDASRRFWQAVWGYYDLTDKTKRMDEEERFARLYEYGCFAQEMEEELRDLRKGIRRTASTRPAVVPAKKAGGR